MADPKKLASDAEEAVKKGARTIGEAYRSLPSPSEFREGLGTAASAVNSMRNMQVTAPQAKPEDFDLARSLWSKLAEAQGYYRGYVRPKIEGAWRDLTK